MCRIGYSSIHDCGPPPSSYTCPSSNSCQAVEKMDAHTSRVGRLSSAQASYLSRSAVVSYSKTVTRSTSSVTTSSSKIHATPSRSHGIQADAAFHNGNSADGLAPGVKAAIVVVSLILLVFLCGTLGCWIFHKRKRRKGSLSESNLPQESSVQGHDDEDPAEDVSQHPRTSYTNSLPSSIARSRGDDSLAEVMLLPPPRLGERKFLSSFGSTSGNLKTKPVPSTTRTTTIRTSPTAAELPNFSLKHQKGFVPGNKRGVDIVHAHPRSRIVESRILNTSKPQRANNYNSKRSSVNLWNMFPPAFTATTKTAGVRTAPSQTYVQTPTSPGPPPTKALPQTPTPSRQSLNRRQAGLAGKISQLPSGNPTQKHAAAGASLVSTYNPARGVTLHQEARDFCDLTEECAREAGERQNRDHWQETRQKQQQDGVSGSEMIGSERRGGGKSPPLKEADLERLAGKY